MKFIKNMGTADRILRVLLAALFITLYSKHVITGTSAILLMTLSVIFMLTGLISFCPLYLPFDFSTNRKQK